jgi:molybdopterin-guanine dinucleotide biosynthesis protein A
MHTAERDVTGAVIAGGTSRRLGTDKRLVTVDGRTLLARTVDTLRPLVDDVHVVVATDADRAVVHDALAADAGPVDASSQDVRRDVRVEVDARPGEGPAAGLETALASAHHDLVLVVATDHPWLTPDVLTLLVTRARGSSALATVLAGARGPEPLLAVYRRGALPTVRLLLDTGVRRLQDVLGALDATVVPAAAWRALDPEGRTLRDVDLPDDLRRLGSRAAPHRGLSDAPSAGT